MEEIKPNKSVENRRPNGTFGAGNVANPNGRPKGKTIKERVREYLEKHPKDMSAFVKHFIKENRELAWQMLEGRPSQAIAGDPINPLIVQISKEIADKNAINEGTIHDSD